MPVCLAGYIPLTFIMVHSSHNLLTDYVCQSPKRIKEKMNHETESNPLDFNGLIFMIEKKMKPKKNDLTSKYYLDDLLKWRIFYRVF